MGLERRAKTITSVLVSLGTSGLLATSLVVRAVDPVPPPPPMPEANAPSTSQAPAKPKSEKSQSANVTGNCVNCAVIRSIRTVERERATPRQVPSYINSSQYQNTVTAGGPPLVGPVVGFTFGPGSSSQGFVGAAGSPAMRERLMQISYEVILLFDDGRFGLLELDDVGDFRANDRVRVVNNMLEPLPRQ